MTLSISEVVERIHRIDAEIAARQTERATLCRILEREALRQEEEDRARLRQEKNDWTAAYKGQTGRILSAIWNTPNRKLKTIKICEAGWGNAAVSQNTFRVAIWRINQQLKADHCRYYLKPIRHKITGEMAGYRLKKAVLQKFQE